MHAHSVTVATALAKRAVAVVTDPHKVKVDLAPWAWGLMVVNAIVLLPVFFYVGYTLNLLPIYAMIEDPSPPAYEPVSLTDDSAGDDVENATAPGTRKPLPPLPNNNNQPISASVRNLHRMLLRISGWRSLFRGILPGYLFLVCHGLVAALASSIFPMAIASLFAYAVTLPLSTAWLHVVISPPTPVSFWNRIPPLRKTFSALALPLLAVWGASLVLAIVPWVLLPAQYRRSAAWGGAGGDVEVPQPTGRDGALIALVIVLQVLVVLFVAVPAEAVYRRVQASMLPADVDTIVPFDRAFGGQVVPAVAGGPGFAHWRIALKTFDAEAWKRLIWLYVKIIALNAAVFVGLIVVLVPQAILVYKKCKKE